MHIDRQVGKDMKNVLVVSNKLLFIRPLMLLQNKQNEQNLISKKENI